MPKQIHIGAYKSSISTLLPLSVPDQMDQIKIFQRKPVVAASGVLLYVFMDPSFGHKAWLIDFPPGCE